MDRPTKTTSGRWEVKGDPEKWECKSAEKWQSKSTGTADMKKMEKWIEEMNEWSEMMHEAVIELREKVVPGPGISGIRQELHDLSQKVVPDIRHELLEFSEALALVRKDLDEALKRLPPLGGPESRAEEPTKPGKGGNK